MVVVVVVVESEPPPGPELDPEEPPSEELWPEPSLPEMVEVLLLPPSLLPLVVGGTTAVASFEPSRPLPNEPSPEDVRKSPLPDPDSREPPLRVCDCSSVE